MILTTANNIGMDEREIEISPDPRIISYQVALYSLEALNRACEIGVPLVVVRSWNDSFTECYGDVLLTEDDGPELIGLLRRFAAVL